MPGHNAAARATKVTKSRRRMAPPRDTHDPMADPSTFRADEQTPGALILDLRVQARLSVVGQTRTSGCATVRSALPPSTDSSVDRPRPKSADTVAKVPNGSAAIIPPKNEKSD